MRKADPSTASYDDELSQFLWEFQWRNLISKGSRWTQGPKEEPKAKRNKPRGFGANR